MRKGELHMGEEAKSKITEMPLQQRLKYGYKKVLDMLLVSGGISIVAVLLVYFGGKANIFGAESGTVATFFLIIGLANVIIVGIGATMIAKKSVIRLLILCLSHYSRLK